MAISRAAVGVTSVLNFSQLLRHVPNEFRGRVFSTLETLTWGVMMLSMLAAGVASQTLSPRTIGALSGALSSMTALYWFSLDVSGRLPQPPETNQEKEEVEVHEPIA
jgi:hypothetical protein